MADVTPTYPRIRWRDSLMGRIILLCVILVGCLLGSVVAITRHYFIEVVQEMETQARTVGDHVVAQLETTPDVELTDVEDAMMEQYPEFDGITLAPDADATAVSSVTIERAAEGRLTKLARLPLTLGDGQTYLLTLHISSMPQTEIVRAFKNKYLAALAVVFVVALGLMVYLVARTLRPLTDLSESCAKIGSGHLQDVAVRRNTGEILALERTFNKMVGSLRDKETVEAKLRQAQRVSALGTLAAGVAHDVRNPLNTIKLLAGHAADTLGNAPQNNAATKQLETIRSEVHRIEDIVSGFLSLAKERELEPEPHRIDALLEECARLVRKNAETRGIHLTSELRAGETTLELDPKLWTRAVLNVLINALEACPQGGRVRLFSRVTDTACEIEVRDTGPGLSNEETERAFDPYFTTKDTGTGLGLSTTRGIIEEHGGTITLSGADGLGCQVLITMPLGRDR